MSASRRAGLIVTALTAALTAVAGCGARVDMGNSSSGDAAGIRVSDVNAVGRDHVRQGGTLRWGLAAFPTQWNYNQAEGNVMEVKRVIDALMPSVFRTDDKGEPELNTDYVTEAEVTSTDPRQVVTYTLNPKARWSDGTPIGWEDFRAQWQAMNGGDSRYRAASTVGYQDIESVRRGENDHQVVITFADRFNEWPSLFSPLYPRATGQSPDHFDSDWLNKIPVTAGPFKVGRLDPAAKTVTLVRDPAWWGEPARLDRIVYRAMAPDALAGAFRNGEIDVYNMGASADDYDQARSAPGGTVRQAGGSGYRQITFNAGRGPLADVRVRRALTLAIDRQAIAQNDLEGLGWAGRTLGNHFLMNTQAGYQDNAGDLGRYDPGKARDLLDAAGWALHGDTRVKGGKPLALRFVVPAGQRLGMTEGRLVQSMLQQVGVKVTVQQVPGERFFDKYVIPGDFDLAAFSYGVSPYPMSSGYAVFAAGASGGGGASVWSGNLSRIGSAKIDEAMRHAVSDLDPDSARKDVNDVDKLVWQEAGVLPLYQWPESWAVRGSLANIGAPGFGGLRYADMGFTA